MNNGSNSKPIFSPEKLFAYKKAMSEKMGLTVREFDLNYDAVETSRGYRYELKKEVAQRIRRRLWEAERNDYEAAVQYMSSRQQR